MARTKLNKSQVEWLRDKLLSGSTVTPLSVEGDFNVKRLTSRIFDVKVKYGLPIVSELRRADSGERYKAYWLSKAFLAANSKTPQKMCPTLYCITFPFDD